MNNANVEYTQQVYSVGKTIQNVFVTCSVWAYTWHYKNY